MRGASQQADHTRSQVSAALTRPRVHGPSTGTWGPFSPHCSESLVNGIKYGQGGCKRYHHFTPLVDLFIFPVCTGEQKGPPESTGAPSRLTKTGPGEERAMRRKNATPSTSLSTLLTSSPGRSEAGMTQRSDSGLPSWFKLRWECLRSLKEIVILWGKRLRSKCSRNTGESLLNPKTHPQGPNFTTAKRMAQLGTPEITSG